MNHSSMSSFMWGLGVGAAVAVLFAPQSGARTQALISKKARRVRENLDNLAADAQNSAIDLLEKGRKEAARQRQGLENAVEAGTRAYKESVG